MVETRFMIPPEDGSFGAYLRAKRLEKGFSQEALGDLVGMKQSHVSAYETGRVQFPDIPQMRALEHVLGLSEGDLANRSGWATVRKFRNRHNDSATIYITDPSPTLRALIMLVAEMGETEIDQLLRYAKRDNA